MERFAVVSRRAVTPSGLAHKALIVSDGRVEALAEPAGLGDVPVIDVGERVLMPGLVDPHVHINEPGRTDWEGFATATRAAAAGGVTTLVDMPLNSLPVTTTPEALTRKVEAAAGKLRADVGLWGGVIPGNVPHLEALMRGGVWGFKAFLVHSGIDEFPNADEATLRAAMPLLAAAGVPLLAHAELELDTPSLEGCDPTHYATFMRSRPMAWEDEAIALMIGLCRETGCAVHIVHLAAASSLDQLRAARAEGLPLTVETCPHYLCLEAGQIKDGETRFKCAPPIRDAANREALWEGLRDGTIDFIASDHSPCPPALKLPDAGDFMRAWGGIASLQLGLSAVWTEARQRGFGVEQVARWMCHAPAEAFGLDAKGRFEPGADADFVVWDPDARFSVEADGLHHRHKVSPYVGQTLMGKVCGTWLRGSKVFEDEGAPEFPGSPVGRVMLRAHDGG